MQLTWDSNRSLRPSSPSSSRMASLRSSPLPSYLNVSSNCNLCQAPGSLLPNIYSSSSNRHSRRHMEDSNPITSHMLVLVLRSSQAMEGHNNSLHRHTASMLLMARNSSRLPMVRTIRHHMASSNPDLSSKERMEHHMAHNNSSHRHSMDSRPVCQEALWTQLVTHFMHK